MTASTLFTRPAHPRNNQVTYATRNGYVAELILTPEGLRFAIRQPEGKVTIESQFGDFIPLQWVAEFAAQGDIKLPSAVGEYSSLDDLADEIRGFVHRYFECPETFERVMALYVLNSWVFDCSQSVPYLRLLGRFPGIGKTRGSEVAGALSYRVTTIAGSQTAAPLFHMIEAIGGTLFIDEADFRDSEIGSDIAKILNCGYQKGLPVIRMEKTEGGIFVPRRYETFGPKIINGRERFKDDATETRCLTYSPKAATRTDIPFQLPAAFHEEATAIRNKLLAWRFDVMHSFVPSVERVPGVGNRTNQIISPLLAIVDLLSDSMKESYRVALLEFAQQISYQAHERDTESVEAEIVRVLLRMQRDGAIPTCKEIRRLVLEEMPETERWLTARKIGQILRDDLELKTSHAKQGTVAEINPAQLTRLAKKYDISGEGHLKLPSPVPSPEPPSVTPAVTM